MRAHVRPLAAGLLLVLGGCSRPLDSRQLETEIAAQLEQRFAGGGWAVTCPDDIEPLAGGTFGCRADSRDGETFAIEVTQENADGSVAWRIVG